MADNTLFQAHGFRYASDITQDVWDALERNEAAANTILPFAREAVGFARGGAKQLWIALYDQSKNVAFVLSCTHGPMGDHPIFIVDCRSFGGPAEEGDGTSLANAMLVLAQHLLQEFPPQRVFSVFSIENVAVAFAAAFELLMPLGNGIQAHKKPYYEAAFPLCTPGTFVESLNDLTLTEEDMDITLRRATESDVEGVKNLCKELSDTSKPYVLDDERAKLEAETMIKNGQAWVHIIRKDDQEHIACLVATTRESVRVTAVTKVFTHKDWRRKGCALRLLHRVCREVFRAGKETVVLYAGINKEMESAREIYRKVGFQGVDEEHIQQLSGMEKWLEIGFEGTQLGYW